MYDSHLIRRILNYLRNRFKCIDTFRPQDNTGRRCMRFDRESYNELIASQYWKREVRPAMIARACGRCERCNIYLGNRGHVHHTTEAYKYLWKEMEVLHLLRYWCKDCHGYRHGHCPDPMTTPTTDELLSEIERVLGPKP